MRYRHLRRQRAETANRLRLFHAAKFLCLSLCWLAILPNPSNGQTLSLTHPNDLLAMDPAAFAQWLHTSRPTRISAEDKSRILSSLPRQGEVSDLDVVALTKLGGLRRVLHAVDRASVYVIKVIDVPQAAVGLHARAVVLISQPALELLGTDELQALAAHEIGHEYVWNEYARAVRLEQPNRVKELELICDAIAIVTLHRLGMDWSALISGIEKITWFNRERFGTAVNERNYPTVAERRVFARSIRAWLSHGAAVTPGQSEPSTISRAAPDSHSPPGVSSQAQSPVSESRDWSNFTDRGPLHSRRRRRATAWCLAIASAGRPSGIC